MTTLRIARRLVLAVLVGAIAGCSPATGPISPAASGAPSARARLSAEPTAAPPASVAASPDGAEAPQELLVVCGGTRTGIPVPFVRARTDGIHLRFTNSSGHEVVFGIDEASGQPLLGDGFSGAGAAFVYTIGPGTYRLTCNDEPATFAVVDPDRVYRPTALVCADASGTSGSIDYGEGATGPRGSVLDVARQELRGLKPGDIVERGGYPDAADEVLIRVVRGGQVVAVIGYADDGHGGWLIGSTRTCAGSNVTVEAP